MSVSTPTPTGSETHPPQAPVAAPETQETQEPREPSKPSVELVDFDRYVVSLDGPIGYVEVVSPVFVCYLGHPYAHAEEIAQVVEFQRAVEIVAGRAATSQRPKLAP